MGKFSDVLFFLDCTYSPAPQLSSPMEVVAFCLWNNKLMWRYIDIGAIFVTSQYNPQLQAQA